MVVCSCLPEGADRAMATFSLTYLNLKRWAERLGLPFQCNDGEQQLAVLCRQGDQDLPLVFIPRIERGMLTLAMTLPFIVPSDRTGAVTDALVRVNARSYMGAWIFNIETREIYFRITVPVLDLAYSDQALRFVASLVASSVAALAAPLQAVVQGSADPESLSKLTLPSHDRPVS